MEYFDMEIVSCELKFHNNRRVVEIVDLVLKETLSQKNHYITSNSQLHSPRREVLSNILSYMHLQSKFFDSPHFRIPPLKVLVSSSEPKTDGSHLVLYRVFKYPREQE